MFYVTLIQLHNLSCKKSFKIQFQKIVKLFFAGITRLPRFFISDLFISDIGYYSR